MMKMRRTTISFLRKCRNASIQAGMKWLRAMKEISRAMLISKRLVKLKKHLGIHYQIVVKKSLSRKEIGL